MDNNLYDHRSYPNVFEFVVVLEVEFEIDQELDRFRIFGPPEPYVVDERFKSLKKVKETNY